MVDELRQALEQAQQRLSDDAQRLLAAQIEAWLDEQEWDALVSSPQGQETLERLAAEARAEIARGDVEEGGWE
jgi:hypothetical protein